MIEDLDKKLKKIIKENKVVVGSRETLKKKDEANLIILASNCPPEVREELKGAEIIEYPGIGIELGAACGKPFGISALAILEPCEELESLRSEE